MRNFEPHPQHSNIFKKLNNIETEIWKRIRLPKKINPEELKAYKERLGEILVTIQDNIDLMSHPDIELWKLKHDYFYNYLNYKYNPKFIYYKSLEEIKIKISKRDNKIAREFISYIEPISDSAQKNISSKMEENLSDSEKEQNKFHGQWFLYRNNSKGMALALPELDRVKVLTKANLSYYYDRECFYKHFNDEVFLKNIVSKIKLKENIDKAFDSDEIIELANPEENSEYLFLAKKLFTIFLDQESIQEFFKFCPILKELYNSKDPLLKNIIDTVQLYNIITKANLTQAKQLVSNKKFYTHIWLILSHNSTLKKKFLLNNPYAYADEYNLPIEDLILGKKYNSKRHAKLKCLETFEQPQRVDAYYKLHMQEFTNRFNLKFKTTITEDNLLLEHLIKNADEDELKTLLRRFPSIIGKYTDKSILKLIIEKVSENIIEVLNKNYPFEELYRLLASSADVLSRFIMVDYSLEENLNLIIKKSKEPEKVAILLLKLLTCINDHNLEKAQKFMKMTLGSHHESVSDIIIKGINQIFQTHKISQVHKLILEDCLLNCPAKILDELSTNVLYYLITIPKIKIQCFKKIASNLDAYQKFINYIKLNHVNELNKILDSNIYFKIYSFRGCTDNYSSRLQMLASKILDNSIYQELSDTIKKMIESHIKNKNFTIKQFVNFLLEIDSDLKSYVIKFFDFYNYKLLDELPVVNDAIFSDSNAIIKRLISKPSPQLISEDYFAGILYFYNKMGKLENKKKENKLNYSKEEIDNKEIFDDRVSQKIDSTLIIFENLINKILQDIDNNSLLNISLLNAPVADNLVKFDAYRIKLVKIISQYKDPHKIPAIIKPVKNLINNNYQFIEELSCLDNGCLVLEEVFNELDENSQKLKHIILNNINFLTFIIKESVKDNDKKDHKFIINGILEDRFPKELVEKINIYFQENHKNTKRFVKKLSTKELIKLCSKLPGIAEYCSNNPQDLMPINDGKLDLEEAASRFGIFSEIESKNLLIEFKKILFNKFNIEQLLAFIKIKPDIKFDALNYLYSNLNKYLKDLESNSNVFNSLVKMSSIDQKLTLLRECLFLRNGMQSNVTLIDLFFEDEQGHFNDNVALKLIETASVIKEVKGLALLLQNHYFKTVDTDDKLATFFSVEKSKYILSLLKVTGILSKLLQHQANRQSLLDHFNNNQEDLEIFVRDLQQDSKILFFNSYREDDSPEHQKIYSMIFEKMDFSQFSEDNLINYFNNLKPSFIKGLLAEKLDENCLLKILQRENCSSVFLDNNPILLTKIITILAKDSFKLTAIINNNYLLEKFLSLENKNNKQFFLNLLDMDNFFALQQFFTRDTDDKQLEFVYSSILQFVAKYKFSETELTFLSENKVLTRVFKFLEVKSDYREDFVNFCANNVPLFKYLILKDWLNKEEILVKKELILFILESADVAFFKQVSYLALKSILATENKKLIKAIYGNVIFKKLLRQNKHEKNQVEVEVIEEDAKQPIDHFEDLLEAFALADEVEAIEAIISEVNHKKPGLLSKFPKFDANILTLECSKFLTAEKIKNIKKSISKFLESQKEKQKRFQWNIEIKKPSNFNSSFNENYSKNKEEEEYLKKIDGQILEMQAFTKEFYKAIDVDNYKDALTDKDKAIIGKFKNFVSRYIYKIDISKTLFSWGNDVSKEIELDPYIALQAFPYIRSIFQTFATITDKKINKELKEFLVLKYRDGSKLNKGDLTINLEYSIICREIIKISQKLEKNIFDYEKKKWYIIAKNNISQLLNILPPIMDQLEVYGLSDFKIQLEQFQLKNTIKLLDLTVKTGGNIKICLSELFKFGEQIFRELPNYLNNDNFFNTLQSLIKNSNDKLGFIESYLDNFKNTTIEVIKNRVESLEKEIFNKNIENKNVQEIACYLLKRHQALSRNYSHNPYDLTKGNILPFEVIWTFLNSELTEQSIVDHDEQYITIESLKQAEEISETKINLFLAFLRDPQLSGAWLQEKNAKEKLIAAAFTKGKLGLSIARCLFFYNHLFISSALTSQLAIALEHPRDESLNIIHSENYNNLPLIDSSPSTELKSLKVNVNNKKKDKKNRVRNIIRKNIRSSSYNFANSSANQQSPELTKPVSNEHSVLGDMQNEYEAPPPPPPAPDNLSAPPPPPPPGGLLSPLPPPAPGMGLSGKVANKKIPISTQKQIDEFNQIFELKEANEIAKLLGYGAIQANSKDNEAQNLASENKKKFLKEMAGPLVNLIQEIRTFNVKGLEEQIGIYLLQLEAFKQNSDLNGEHFKEKILSNLYNKMMIGIKKLELKHFYQLFPKNDVTNKELVLKFGYSLDFKKIVKKKINNQEINFNRITFDDKIAPIVSRLYSYMKINQSFSTEQLLEWFSSEIDGRYILSSGTDKDFEKEQFKQSIFIDLVESLKKKIENEKAEAISEKSEVEKKPIHTSISEKSNVNRQALFDSINQGEFKLKKVDAKSASDSKKPVKDGSNDIFAALTNALKMRRDRIKEEKEELPDTSDKNVHTENVSDDEDEWSVEEKPQSSNRMNVNNNNSSNNNQVPDSSNMSPLSNMIKENEAVEEKKDKLAGVSEQQLRPLNPAKKSTSHFFVAPKKTSWVPERQDDSKQNQPPALPQKSSSYPFKQIQPPAKETASPPWGKISLKKTPSSAKLPEIPVKSKTAPANSLSKVEEQGESERSPKPK